MTSSDLLELPAFRERIMRLTVEQYHKCSEYSPRGRPTELIRGFIFEKMAKSPLHASTSDLLDDLLTAQIPAGFILRRENPLTLAATNSEPEPDFAIVRGNREEVRAAHPVTAALVIEIAVTTLTGDPALAALYAEGGVEEYWIIIPRERRIEVYRLPHERQYSEQAMVERKGTLECRSVPGVKIALAELFA